MPAIMIAPGDDTISDLLDQARHSLDPYQAAALHPWLDASRRAACEKIIFSQRRHPRLFAQASHTPVSLLQRLALEKDSITLNKLVKNTATPSMVLKQLLQGDDGRQRQDAVAAHPNASAALLDSIDDQESPVLRQAICYNRNTGLMQLYRLLPHASLYECKGMAQNPHADSALLRKLWAVFGDQYLHAEIAHHNNCPTELLSAALNSESPLLRRKAAGNVNLSDRQLVDLLTDSDARVRAASLRQLEHATVSLIDEPARRVRREMARKSVLDLQLIKNLGDDEDHWVRRWVARNPVTPESVLRKLANDEQIEVRRGVARNPSAPIDLITELASDMESWVRAAVTIRGDLNQQIIRQLQDDESVDVLAGLGRNPASPQALLGRIAGHPDRDVRRAVTLNPQASSEVLERLLEDPYPINRATLCRHPALGDDELWQLTVDPEAQVRFSAVQQLCSRSAAAAANDLL